MSIGMFTPLDILGLGIINMLVMENIAAGNAHKRQHIEIHTFPHTRSINDFDLQWLNVNIKYTDIAHIMQIAKIPLYFLYFICIL